MENYNNYNDVMDVDTLGDMTAENQINLMLEMPNNVNDFDPLDMFDMTQGNNGFQNNNIINNEQDNNNPMVGNGFFMPNETTNIASEEPQFMLLSANPQQSEGGAVEDVYTVRCQDGFSGDRGQYIVVTVVEDGNRDTWIHNELFHRLCETTSSEVIMKTDGMFSFLVAHLVIDLVRHNNERVSKLWENVAETLLVLDRNNLFDGTIGLDGTNDIETKLFNFFQNVDFDIMDIDKLPFLIAKISKILFLAQLKANAAIDATVDDISDLKKSNDDLEIQLQRAIKKSRNSNNKSTSSSSSSSSSSDMCRPDP